MGAMFSSSSEPEQQSSPAPVFESEQGAAPATMGGKKGRRKTRRGGRKSRKGRSRK
jgi:hypothetical protein